MFTGIVQGTGSVVAVRGEGDLRALAIELPAGFAEGLDVGASVSVDGVCLTVTSVGAPDQATFDVILPSLALTTLVDCAPGRRVNVERAAKDGAEIGGHPLSGHVDFSTIIESVSESGGNRAVRISIPQPFQRYMFAKGYIAVDGCSLTVSDCDRALGWFEVWLIPETRRTTTLGQKVAGDRLNIEIERGTQVVVDTVRDTITEVLGGLRPALENLLRERGLVLEELVARDLRLPRTH